MKPFFNRSDSVSATKGNALVYVLWFLGIAGALVFGLAGAHTIPIAERDFVSVWLAGKMAISGHATDIYDLHSLRAAGAAYAGTTYKITFPYPPHILFICIPLALLPLPLAFFVWEAVSAALFYVAARSHLPTGMPRLLAVVTPSALVNITYGQNGLFFGALWLFAFRGSGLSGALLTIKPHLGFLVSIEAVRRRLFLKMSAIAIVIISLSVLLFGWTTWRASISAAAKNQFSFMAAGAFPNWYMQMTTPYIGYGYLGWVLFGGAAIFLLTRRFDVFTAATATFLISPYGFHYDMTVVCLGFGVLLLRSWRLMAPWQTVVCALAFLSPLLVRAGTWLVPPLLLAGLYVMTTSPVGGVLDFGTMKRKQSATL